MGLNTPIVAGVPQVRIDVRDEMAAFDRLAPQVRALLNYGPVSLSAHNMSAVPSIIAEAAFWGGCHDHFPNWQPLRSDGI